MGHTQSPWNFLPVRLPMHWLVFNWPAIFVTTQLGQTYGIEEIDITAYVPPHLPLSVPRCLRQVGARSNNERRKKRTMLLARKLFQNVVYGIKILHVLRSIKDVEPPSIRSQLRLRPRCFISITLRDKNIVIKCLVAARFELARTFAHWESRYA